MQAMRIVRATCVSSSLLSSVIALTISATALAQTKSEDKGAESAAKDTKKGKDGDPQAMVAAYEKAAQPGEQHKVLLKMVGKWNLQMKSWMAPGGQPVESTGTAEVKPMLGDRFTQTLVTSNFMGKPFSGMAVTGYDNAKKKIVGTWVDSMSTGIMHSEGTADPAGKVITTQMVGTDPLTGKESKSRVVETHESDDKYVEEFFEKKGGKETKVMEITYTRAK
jgi:hypothetical protein